MELPRVRRYRKKGFDQLYVYDSDDTLLGWSDTISGRTEIHMPGADARVEAALEAWANTYPEDDIANHSPGRHTSALVATWDVEIQDLEHHITQLQAMRDMAIYQRDQYAKGTAGEHRVGAILNKLYRHDWGVLHSIPIHDGATDVDHLLMGPGGVWTLNAKRHTDGRVTINGDSMVIGRTRVDYIRAARREADNAGRCLAAAGVEVPVQSAVVLDGPRNFDLDIRRNPRGVAILPAKGVVDHFRRLPRTCDQQLINRVFAAARVPGTWGA